MASADHRGGCESIRLFLCIFSMCLQYAYTVVSNKKDFQRKSSKALYCLVPGERIELSQPQGSRDFKSLASTSSATQAQFGNNGINFAVYIIFGLRCQGFDREPPVLQRFPRRLNAQALISIVAGSRSSASCLASGDWPFRALI